MVTTKAKILQHYEREVRSRYAWASDKEKLHKFMKVALDMLEGHGPGVDRKGPGWNAALTAAGLPANMSLKALMALPLGDVPEYVVESE